MIDIEDVHEAFAARMVQVGNDQSWRSWVVMEVLVAAINAELESMVARADTQLLERTLVVIATEIQRREREGLP